MFLAPSNTLPFVGVATGAYPDMAESADETQLQNRKERINGQWPRESEANRPSRESAFGVELKAYAGDKAQIQTLREKHPSRLGKPAGVRNIQPTFTGR